MRYKTTLKTLVAFVVAGATASAFAVALTPGNGTWVKETTLFGLQDAYTYVPKNTAPAVIGQGRALMLTLHGCAMTASGNVINKKYNWEDTAEKYGMVVIAPTVPSGTTSTRSYSGCWDWFGANHSRTTRDEAILLKLIDAVKARPELNIDPKQIYVTGLSSGGGLVVALGCVAPDYFAGMGINTGPALNTAANAGVGSKAVRTPQQIAADCKAYAGPHSTALLTQLTSVVNGSKDTTVDPTHSWANRDGMKVAYGATVDGGSFTETKSVGRVWKDTNGIPRVSYIEATDMAHAWPAGAGGSGGGIWVDYTHVNYPSYVTKFFFDNNLRVARDPNQPAPTSTTTTTTTSTSTTTTTTVPPVTPPPVTPPPVEPPPVEPPPGPAPVCYTASNYAHVLAGRAYSVWGTARALGSNQYMGFVNTFTTTTLKKTGTYSYAIGTCN